MINTIYQYNFSEEAEASIDNCLYYLLYQVGGTGNIQAATNFLKNLEQTLQKISHSANAYAFCEEDELREIGLRKIHFPHMNYKMFFQLKDKSNQVRIVLVAHDMQDYSRILLDND